jgi:O-antigen/teichoic acid export membrane protein
MQMNHTFKQTFLLSASNAVTRFMGMLFFVILARSLTVAEYGLFRYLLTISSIYALAFTGVPTALTKFFGDSSIESEQKSEYLSNSLFLILLIYLVLAAIIILFTAHKLLLLFFIFALLIDLLYVGLVRGKLDYLKLNGFKLLENIIQLFILVLAYIIYKQVNLTFSVIFYSTSGLVSLAVFEIIKPDFKIRWRYSRQRIIEILRYSIPVTLGSVGWTLLFAISSIYIEHFYGSEQVGYFSVGLTLMQIFSFLPDSINTIILPKVAGLRDKKKVISPLRLAALSSLAVSVLLFIPIYLFRDLLIGLIFSSKYLPAAAVLLPLTISQIFLVMQQFYGTAWQGLGKPTISSIVISIAAGVNLVLGYFMTRDFGIVGASVSLAISGFVAWVIMMLIWRRWVKRGGLETASQEIS